MTFSKSQLSIAYNTTNALLFLARGMLNISLSSPTPPVMLYRSVSRPHPTQKRLNLLSQEPDGRMQTYQNPRQSDHLAINLVSSFPQLLSQSLDQPVCHLQKFLKGFYLSYAFRRMWQTIANLVVVTDLVQDLFTATQLILRPRYSDRPWVKPRCNGKKMFKTSLQRPTTSKPSLQRPTLSKASLL